MRSTIRKKPYQQLSAKAADVAAMLGYSDTKSVYKLIRQGKIKARKEGNTYLVRLDSVRAYLGMDA